MGEHASFPQEQEGVAAVGFVHYVARDEQRHTALGEIVEEAPEVAAEDGTVMEWD